MYWIFYQGICHNSFILWVVHIISYIHLYSCWMLLSYFVWAYTLHSFHHMYSILVGYEKTHGERSMILCLQMFLKKIITKKRPINAFFGEWQIFILRRDIIQTVRNIKLYFLMEIIIVWTNHPRKESIMKEFFEVKRYYRKIC